MAKTKTDIWMPIYVGDYLGDTMHLTTEQHGAYFLLMLAYWKNRGPLPKNKVKAIVTIDDYSWTILEEFFDTTSSPGMWIHNRIEEELKKSLIRKQAAENRGKKGMKARWGDKKKDSSTIDEGIVGDSTSPSPSHKKNKDIVPYGDIIAYLNEKTGKHFGATSKTTRGFISARWNENPKFQNIKAFQYVIDVKCQAWLDDPKQSAYLRPQTLFGTKFESYLNEVLHEPIL